MFFGVCNKKKSSCRASKTEGPERIQFFNPGLFILSSTESWVPGNVLKIILG